MKFGESLHADYWRCLGRERKSHEDLPRSPERRMKPKDKATGLIVYELNEVPGGC